MNKRLDQALSQVQSLPDDEQDIVADILFDYLEGQNADVKLTPEQVAEIERRLADPHFATDEEVKEFFDRFGK
jgi:hypothetical protein